MFSYKKELVKALDQILPTYDEFFIDIVDAPCITYLELSNIAEQEGNSLRYSRLNYRISVWGGIDDDLDEYIPQIDSIMFSLGFKRKAYNELYEDVIQRKIFTYEALALEVV